MYVNRILKSAFALTGAAVILTACAGTTDSPTGPNAKLVNGGAVSLVLQAPVYTSFGSETFTEESFVVCKVFAGGGTVTSASFLIEVDDDVDGTFEESTNISLDHNECADFGLYGGNGINFRVSETGITDHTTQWTSQTASKSSIDPADPLVLSAVSSPTVGLVATGSAYGNRGANIALGTRIVFTNTYNPPQTGEGCTPGYWRQEHHFGNWTAPYDPTDSFNTTFGIGTNWFANSYTLLDGVWANGGGKNALARHAVAALLNAASANVDYDYTVAEVLAMVQAAYADGSLIESTKNDLAAKNELGCGLARAEVGSSN
jgi:hypothetical protein